MRGLRSLILAVVVLGGLLGYIYFVDAKRPAGGAEEKEKAFTGIEADKIEELRITSAGGETTRLVKGGNGWEIVEPEKASADASELSSVTSNLGTLEIQRVVDDNPGNLAEYGLNPPRVDVGFRLKDQKDFRHLLIGDKTPTGGDLYAKLHNDNKVFLVSSFLENTFNRTPFDLRDKRILEFDREKVDALELASRTGTVQFARSGSDWKIARPFEARADFGTVEGLVTRLSSGQMQRIVDPAPTDLTKYGLDKPTVTAVVSTGSSRATLALGMSEGGATYAKDASRPMVFAVDDTLATDLGKDVGEFRRKDIFDFRPFNAQRIEIKRGADSFVFEKAKHKDGKEVWRKAGGQAGDSTKIEDLLMKLSNLRATGYDSSTHASLKSPAMSVTATFDGKSETVLLGRAGDNVYASRTGEPGSARVELTPYEDALKALEEVK